MGSITQSKGCQSRQTPRLLLPKSRPPPTRQPVGSLSAATSAAAAGLLRTPPPRPVCDRGRQQHAHGVLYWSFLNGKQDTQECVVHMCLCVLRVRWSQPSRTSTLPSRLLRTQPVRPSSAALDCGVRARVCNKAEGEQVRADVRVLLACVSFRTLV